LSCLYAMPDALHQLQIASMIDKIVYCRPNIYLQQKLVWRLVYLALME
jgi:hypothetical protein